MCVGGVREVLERGLYVGVMRGVVSGGARCAWSGVWSAIGACDNLSLNPKPQATQLVWNVCGS